MKFKIGYRTLKTAVGASLAIFLAQLLQLEFYVSAGIVTILCIQPTKKSSISSSLVRLYSCIIGLALSFIIFETLGYNPISIGLLLLLFLPILVHFKIQAGFVTSSVILFHIYSMQSFTLNSLINELLIIAIGIGIALLINLYMPNLEKDLRTYQIRVEDFFRIIFKEYAHFLKSGDSNWTGKELLDVAEVIQTAKFIALKDIENHLIRPKESFYYYFTMREKQLDILERMLPLISTLNEKVDQRIAIADYLIYLSQKINPKDTVSESAQRLYKMRDSLRQTDLPKSREEFEARASLFHLIVEIEQFLLIKEQSFQHPEKTKIKQLGPS